MNEKMNELTGEEICTQKDNQGILRFSSRIWIPNVEELKNEILKDAHNSEFSIHPGKNEDVPRFEAKLLVARHEEGNCSIDQ